MDMTAMNQIVGDIDSFVWGPVMLCLLVGTGIYLTAYLNFRTWRNLPRRVLRYRYVCPGQFHCGYYEDDHRS